MNGRFEAAVTDRSPAGGGTPWIELSLANGRRERIGVGQHYVLLDSGLVGIAAHSNLLLLERGRPAGSNPIVKAIRWDAMFGGEATHGQQAALAQEASIVDAKATAQGVEVTVRTLQNLNGRLVFDPALQLLSVELEGEPLPVFFQPHPVGDHAQPGRLWRATAGGGPESATVWYALFAKDAPPQSAARMCVAGARIDGGMVLWAGPPPSHWLLAKGGLFGIGPGGDGSILVRRGVPMAPFWHGTTLSKAQAAEAERAYFTGHEIPMGGAVQDPSKLRIRSAAVSDGVLAIAFQSDTVDSGEVKYPIGSAAAEISTGGNPPARQAVRSLPKPR